ncbi:MAG: type I-U CRISPR-associated RAMP protein Csb1/Cas7u [Gemmataceae bacterium]
MTELNLTKLQELVRSGAAARSRVVLQPAGGEGTKVFPPTYAGAVYAMEKRRLPGYTEPVDCVLLDSVQSQANRMEEALQQAVDAGRISIPVVEVDFTPFENHKDKTLCLLEPMGKVTSLQAPHRIVDAILRDSVVNEEGEDKGKLFRAKDGAKESSIGQRLRRVTAHNATALFELCPTALLLGMWDSTGPKGGLGAKFERAMVSEIVGINAVRGCKSSSRLDPLAIQKDAGPLYRRPDGGFTTDPSQALDELKEGKPTGKKILFKQNSKGQDVAHDPKESSFPDQGRPSEANHGNVTPSISEKDREGEFLAGGVTIDRAEQTIVLSFPALRRFKFPIKGEAQSRPEVDVAARTVLAALGLCAVALTAEAGLDLRSRCLLWPNESLKWELLGKPGEKEEGITLEADHAVKLLKEAIDAAKKLGLPWREQPLQLRPSDELVKLVVKSQELAQQQGSEGGE